MFNAFLARKQGELGIELAAAREVAEHLSAGWAFFYQSRAYLETGEDSSFLVGNDPAVVKNDGTIIDGGWLDVDPEALLTR